ncbi:hypothetical protein EDB85DRAFT_1892942 [Lactarius pseudohatsudake]|nr:hypothetical protein EDB85DRAFT_1892942 [Lactarius pseudohatsudake]
MTAWHRIALARFALSHNTRCRKPGIRLATGPYVSACTRLRRLACPQHLRTLVRWAVQTPSMREGWSYRSPAPISRSGYIKEWDITPSEKSTFLERLFSQARQLYTGISPQAHARPPSRPRITGDTGGRPYSTPSSAPYATRLPLALTRSSRSSGYF